MAMSEVGEVGAAEAGIVASEAPQREKTLPESAPEPGSIEAASKPESAFDKLFSEEGTSRDIAAATMEALDEQGAVTDDQSREWASISIASLLSRYTSEELARLSNEATDSTIMSLLSPVTKIIQALAGK